MPSQRLRRRARQIAQGSVAPQRSALHSQIAGAHHDERRGIRSVNSEGNAIDSAISGARHDFKHTPGLSGRDERIALETLARDRIYNAEGTAAQAHEVRAETASTLADLRGQVGSLGAQEAANYASTLESMLQARQANRAQMRSARYTQGQENLRELIMHPPTGAAGSSGSSSSSSSSPGGLTANEQRGIQQDRKNALALVRQALAESHHSGGTTITNPSTGKPVLGPDGQPVTIPKAPKTEKQWQSWGDQLYGKIHSYGVSRGDVGWAIAQLQGKGPQDPLGALAGATPVPAIANLGLEVARLLGAAPPAPAQKPRRKAPPPTATANGLPPYLRGLTLPK